MKFKIVMGYIYLAIFIGVFGWKFMTVMEGKEDAGVITFLVVVIILGISLLVRKLIFMDS